MCFVDVEALARDQVIEREFEELSIKTQECARLYRRWQRFEIAGFHGLDETRLDVCGLGDFIKSQVTRFAGLLELLTDGLCHYF